MAEKTKGTVASTVAGSPVPQPSAQQYKRFEKQLTAEHKLTLREYQLKLAKIKDEAIQLQQRFAQLMEEHQKTDGEFAVALESAMNAVGGSREQNFIDADTLDVFYRPADHEGPQ